MTMEYQEYVGYVVEVPNIGRGQIRYIGPVENKSGTFVGVDLFSGNGKNNGTFRDKRYFETSFPQSGLFIQWEKVANLLPQYSASERSIDRRSSSPTPVRNGFKHSSGYRSRSPSGVEITSSTTSRKASITKHQSVATPVSNGVDDIDTLKEELARYKLLVEDQRIVLEEIQATIDEYETKFESTEREKALLQNKLELDRASHERQKQFYENEHEQLLTVIDELQGEITRNASILAEIMQREKNSTLGTPEQTPVSEPQHKNNDLLVSDLREQIQVLQVSNTESEAFKAKWAKEREQLQFHNKSLSQEFQAISNELAQCQDTLQKKVLNEEKLLKELAEAKEKIRTLEENVTLLSEQQSNQLSVDENMETLPLYNPLPKPEAALQNAAAGRTAWCALCEKDGHESADCPYDDKFF